jgi:hypothetical protein
MTENILATNPEWVSALSKIVEESKRTGKRVDRELIFGPTSYNAIKNCPEARQVYEEAIKRGAPFYFNPRVDQNMDLLIGDKTVISIRKDVEPALKAVGNNYFLNEARYYGECAIKNALLLTGFGPTVEELMQRFYPQII